MDDSDDRICMNICLHWYSWVKQFRKVFLRHVLTYKNYWSIINLACSPYLYAQGPPVPLGLFIRNILQDHQSIRLVSGINDFLRCQRLNRHGLRMKTLSCIIYVFIYVHELVNLEVPRRTPSRTRPRWTRQLCVIHLWIFVAVSKVKVCRPKAGMHILIFNLSLLSTEFWL